MDSGCADVRMDKLAGLRISSDSSNPKGAGEGGSRKLQVDPNSTSLGKEALVSEALGATVSEPNSPAGHSGATQPAQGSDMAPEPAAVSAGGMASVQRSLRKTGLSKVAAKLVANAVRKSTRKVYEHRFNQYVRWCNKRKINPFQATPVEIANFLSRLYNRNLAHSTICGFRSAISSYHDLVDGKKIGDHPTLNSLLRGIFLLRPPTRTLAPSWDLDRVLQRLKLHPFEPIDKVPLGWLTKKTAFLVAICTAGRGDDLSKLGCAPPYIRIEKNPAGIRFVTRDLRKQDRQGHTFQDIFIPKFKEDRKLDPVRAILMYLKRSEARRGSLASLFITFGNGPAKSPAARTIANWIVDTLERTLEPGQDRKVSAHSTRATSTSVALHRGVSVNNILKAADWSSTSVFAKHYLRRFKEQDAEFARTVLGEGRN